MKRFALLLVVLLAIPVIGVCTSIYLLTDMESMFATVIADVANPALSGLTLGGACEVTSFRAAVSGVCEQQDTVVLLQVASVVCGAVAIALLILIALTARIVGRSRYLLAITFSFGRRLVLAVLGCLVLAQAAIVAYAAFLIETTAFQRVHFVLIGAIALGGLIGGLRILFSGFALARRPRFQEIGYSVTAAEQARLWSFINDVAQKIGARPPQNVVLTIEPTFYATGADVRPLNQAQDLRGETLCLSLSLMRLLTLKELAAVIGHELGHFKGRDIVYSLRFIPVYSDLIKAIESSSRHEGVSNIAVLPALAIMSFFLDCFARMERAISRKREVEADRSGVHAAGAEAMASALMKTGVFAPLWAIEQEHLVEALAAGKVLINGALQLKGIAAARLDGATLSEIAAAVAAFQVPHPTDTHPPLSQRLRAIGIHPVEAAKDVLLPVEGSSELVDGFEQIEQQLTAVQARLFVQSGYVVLPPDDNEAATSSVERARAAEPYVEDGQNHDPTEPRPLRADIRDRLAPPLIRPSRR